MDILKASSGENTKTFLGFDPSENNEQLKKVGLHDFEKMISDAGAESQDVNKRHESAAAQATTVIVPFGYPPTSSSSTDVHSDTYRTILSLHLHGSVGKGKDQSDLQRNETPR